MKGKISKKDVSVVFAGDINKTIPLSAGQTVSGTGTFEAPTFGSLD